jgi:hypothetical protein
MAELSQIKRLREDAPLIEPNADENVWKEQGCPAFEPRESAVVGQCECWYCRCADYHLGKPRAQEVGICCLPKKIMK